MRSRAWNVAIRDPSGQVLFVLRSEQRRFIDLTEVGLEGSLNGLFPHRRGVRLIYVFLCLGRHGVYRMRAKSPLL